MEKKINFTLLDLIYQIKQKMKKIIANSGKTDDEITNGNDLFLFECKVLRDAILGETKEEINLSRSLENITFLTAFISNKSKFSFIKKTAAEPFVVEVPVMYSDFETIHVELINEEGGISGRILEIDSTYEPIKYYALSFPFNKMAEYLVPLSVAVSSKLLLNYILLSY